MRQVEIKYSTQPFPQGDILSIPIADISNDRTHTIHDGWGIRGGQGAFLLVNRRDVVLAELRTHEDQLAIMNDALAFYADETPVFCLLGDELERFYDPEFPPNVAYSVVPYAGFYWYPKNYFDCYDRHNMFSIDATSGIIQSIRKSVERFWALPEDDRNREGMFEPLPVEMEFRRQVACRLQGLIDTIEEGMECEYALSVSGP